MRTKKFNLFCLILTVLLGGYIRCFGIVGLGDYTVVLAVVIFFASILAELFIKTKSEKENPGDLEKINVKSVIHYMLTLITLCVIFYSFGVFRDPSFGYRMFGSGKYGSEISFWDLGEIIPDFAFNLSVYLPLVMLIFAAHRKAISFFAAGVYAWVSILNINTSKFFGEYAIVSASGNHSTREITVYNFSNTVIDTIAILVIVLFVVSVLDLLLFKPKKKSFVLIIIALLLVGCFSAYQGCTAYTEGKVFDIEKMKSEIYTETKEGSEKFQAENFHNNYGSMSTKCAVSGCDNLIVSSGDSNCCLVHSNRCRSCKCYIDGDAMYCMSCISKALQ